MSRAILLVACLAAIAVLVFWGRPEGQGAVAGRIAFVSDQSGDPEIYTVSPDGTELRRTTWTPGTDWSPTWSWDNGFIAFCRSGGDIEEVWRMAADGSDQIRLTPRASGWCPSWSPDGRTIAFSSSRDGWAHIFLMNSDGTGVRRLGSFGRPNYDPAFSPDGRSIAFLYGNYGSDNIAVVPYPYDGSAPKALTNDSGFFHRDLTWSPDGSKIAFCGNPDDDWDIFVINARDGSNCRRLTSGAEEDRHPTWSPDGSHLAFSRKWQGTSGIYLVDRGGGYVRPVLDTPANESEPDWSHARRR